MCHCVRPIRRNEKGRRELLSTALCRNSGRESPASFVSFTSRLGNFPLICATCVRNRVGAQSHTCYAIHQASHASPHLLQQPKGRNAPPSTCRGRLCVSVTLVYYANLLGRCALLHYTYATCAPLQLSFCAPALLQRQNVSIVAKALGRAGA